MGSGGPLGGGSRRGVSGEIVYVYAFFRGLTLSQCLRRASSNRSVFEARTQRHRKRQGFVNHSVLCHEWAATSEPNVTIGAAIYRSPDPVWARNPQKVSQRSSRPLTPECHKSAEKVQKDSKECQKCVNQESLRQTKPKKGAKRKVHEFRPFCEFWCFFLGKTSTIHISNFCSGMSLRKVHELAFLWFGLPGPLLSQKQSSGTCSTLF